MSIFLFLTCFLVNYWAAGIIVLVLADLVLLLGGFLGFLGIQATSVLVVIALGLGVEFTVPVTLGFLTAVGDRNRRMKIALTHMCPPVLDFCVAILLSTSVLAFSEFEFIRR